MNFEKSENNKKNDLIIHSSRRHISLTIFYFILIILAIVFIGLLIYLYTHNKNPINVIIQDSNEEKTEFIYGSWPALQNIDFFQKTKENFISQKISFIEADLSSMIIRFYQNGSLIKEAPIQTKGRDGSWWETPVGIYKINTKAKKLFSSFGDVWMPWSMQFQGNFFIHGPPYYSDGTPTASTYSGGCIRLSLDDAKEIYHLTDIGTPVLVFEKSFNNDKKTIAYKNKNLLPNDVIYLAADLENNFVFAENKSNEKHSIASITKLMSALIAIEYINIEKKVMIDSSMLIKTSIPRLKENDYISILDLLSLLLLESSNEAAIAITNPLGENYFIKLMNAKANAIGMKNSNFADTSGILSANISTAEDLFNLAKHLYYNRSFILHMSVGKENRKIYGSPRYKNLQNLNLIPSITNMIGGKTGFSSSSKDSMLGVFELEIDGQKRPIAIIVLGSNNAKNDIESLLNYIKYNFSIK